MTEMPSYSAENPNLEPIKAKKQYNIYSSLFPFLLSILTYILIFYVLDVSPFSIFNDTKILFFISNALILIIAADYGVFAERENHDFYGEYTAAMRIDPRREHSGYEMGLVEVTMKREKQEKAVRGKEPTRYLLHKEVEVPEKTLQVVSENKLIEKHEPATERNSHKTISKRETCDARNLVSPKPYGRSKSDKARSERRHRETKHGPKSYGRSKSEDSSRWMVVHKWKKANEEAEEKWENVSEESEEFAKMSNEELNRRVEDFIQRFNRDIKRQNFV
ncbi:unnamed protein product [Eruca vesicaria subsp. sativa]|uniref:Uncharacterized protein n=1 Tax=Eruca vesicaria subsp. sativa TaxID=29727 RepID=A0ABC8JZ05_ERUVS|nr:unnamed protein product [Eruca vesicaria subsp. sativa]